MVFYEKKKNQEFVTEFFVMTLIDYFLYQILILITKTIVFFFLIKDGRKTWWKSALIKVISACPWAFAIFG